MLNKLFIGTNLKMYKTIKQTVSFLTELDSLTSDISKNDAEIFIVPSFTALAAAGEIAARSNIMLGAQNMSWEDEGQYTGEISPVMLKEIGVRVVEIGHSERRHVFGENDEVENKKVHAAQRHSLIPLLCIGETERQKELGIADEVLRTQLKVGLFGVKAETAGQIWIAYEPVWAIGINGKPATSEYAAEKHAVIHAALDELFGKTAAGIIPVLYGGSVNNTNAAEFIKMPYIDGLFIGRSAWDAVNFNKIIREVLP